MKSVVLLEEQELCCNNAPYGEVLRRVVTIYKTAHNKKVTLLALLNDKDLELMLRVGSEQEGNMVKILKVL